MSGDRGLQATAVFALRDDAHVVLEREHAGGAGAKNGLIIGKNDAVHGVSLVVVGRPALLAAPPSSACAYGFETPVHFPYSNPCTI